VVRDLQRTTRRPRGQCAQVRSALSPTYRRHPAPNGFSIVEDAMILQHKVHPRILPRMRFGGRSNPLDQWA
jgi:hypothetical protein